MTPSIRQNANAQNAKYIGGPEYSMSVVCKTRADLLDRLAGAIQELGRAKLQLTDTFEEGKALNLESAQFEVFRLRDECTGIRLELEYHRAQHHC